MKELVYSLGFNEKFIDLLNADVVYNLDEFIKTPADKKIVIVVFCDNQRWRENKELLELLEKHADHIVVSLREATDALTSLVKFFDRPKFIFCMGWIPNFEFKHAAQAFTSLWMWKQHWHYYINDVFVSDSRLDNTTTKPFKFECLYGMNKPHREYIREYVCRRTDFLHSEFNTQTTGNAAGYGDTSSLFWESDVILDPDDQKFLKFMDRDMLPSQVMPFKVYNASHYSLVCETWYNNDYSFYTEKTAKPILAKRLFIPVSGQYFLRNLRTLGFKTFDGIIDESFDEEANPIRRFDMIMEEVEKLSKLDPQEVKAQCEDIFEHNRAVLIAIPNFFKRTMELVNLL